MLLAIGRCSLRSPSLADNGLVDNVIDHARSGHARPRSAPTGPYPERPAQPEHSSCAHTPGRTSCRGPCRLCGLGGPLASAARAMAAYRTTVMVNAIVAAATTARSASPKPYDSVLP